jgi:HNH endonuclease
MPFDLESRTKVLLWCDRHCCLCKKACGINIEVHHIEPEAAGGSDAIDNAIPLCFDCHSGVQHYNSDHPRGTKYKSNELKARREQVYEEFTRHLVPPVHYVLTQTLPGGGTRQFPDVGFVITHLGDSLPVKVRVRIEPDRPGERLALPRGYYTGDTQWHLNPRFSISGHFEIPASYPRIGESFTLRLQVWIIDQYEREHEHLPVGYTYVPDGNYWFLEPRGAAHNEPLQRADYAGR